METIKTSYEEQQKKETEKAAEIRAKVIAAVGYLGDGWRVTTQHDDDQPSARWYVRENASDGRQVIYFSSSKFQKWRIYLSGVYPRDNRGQYIRPHGYDEKAHEITISSDKTPEQIAKDIKARFLPKYQEQLASVEALIKKYNDYENSRLANVKKLFGDRVLTEYERKEFKVALHFSGYGHVQVYDDSVNIELSNVDIETARKILAILPPEKTEE